MAEVRLDHLTKRFPGGTLAVQDVSLTVADGEFLVLVGPSGCGKSTVLRMIAGLEDVTGGEIRVDGVPVTGLPPKERDVATVFQNHVSYPRLTVEENPGFGLRPRNVPMQRARVLSGGQRQRVAMGRALVRRPRVFLMDEPLSNLDAKLRVTMRGELTRLRQQYRITTVYVTHDPVEAMTLGDRVAVLDQGRLQQVGTPEELHFAPANQFVAGFMGSPSMNFATVQVRVGDPITLDLAGYIWSLPGALMRWPGLARYVDRTVVLGLRPDAFSVAGDSGDGAALRVAPVSVESLGNEKHILFTPPGRDLTTDRSPLALDEAEAAQLWTAKASARADLAIGRDVDLKVDLTAAYFFDPDNAAAIPATSGAVPAMSGQGSRVVAAAGRRVDRRSPLPAIGRP